MRDFDLEDTPDNKKVGKSLVKTMTQWLNIDM